MEMFAMMMRIPGCIPIYMFEDVYVRSTEVNFSDESENADPRRELHCYNDLDRPIERIFSGKVIDSGATKTIMKADY